MARLSEYLEGFSKSTWKILNFSQATIAIILLQKYFDNGKIEFFTDILLVARRIMIFFVSIRKTKKHGGISIPTIRITSEEI